MVRGLAKDLDVRSPTLCCRDSRTGDAFCHGCDLLFRRDGLHVTSGPGPADRHGGIDPGTDGVPGLRMVAETHSRRAVRPVDASCFDTPVVLVWYKRRCRCRCRCREHACTGGTFTERASSSARAVQMPLFRLFVQVKTSWREVL